MSNMQTKQKGQHKNKKNIGSSIFSEIQKDKSFNKNRLLHFVIGQAVFCLGKSVLAKLWANIIIILEENEICMYPPSGSVSKTFSVSRLCNWLRVSDTVLLITRSCKGHVHCGFLAASSFDTLYMLCHLRWGEEEIEEMRQVKCNLTGQW